MGNASKMQLPIDNKNSPNNSDSQIRQFYAGKRIFLTGCTGFLGTALVEKILRTCKEISKIYIMIRSKKGVSIEERLEDFFRNYIFRKLREENPNFMEKIEFIYGDLEKEDLGLSPEHRRRLVENADVIIHNASIVHFVAKVSRILRTNVIGTQKLLELARECRHLSTFVYVSTAYSHHYNRTIEEKFYPPPADLQMIKDLVRADEENAAGVTKEVMLSVVDKWVNTYSFTIATAEDLLRDFATRMSLPCFVFRPSVVIASYKEPIPWVGNKNGSVVLATAVMEGYLHALYWYEDVAIDVIPVDMAINGLLTAIWDFIVHRISKILFKVMINFKLLSYFICSNWVIKADKLREVQSRMNTADLEEFPCDLSSVDWYRNTKRFATAIRKLINDPPTASIETKRKLRNSKILHYIVCGLFALISLYLLYTTTNSLISFLST